MENNGEKNYLLNVLNSLIIVGYCPRCGKAIFKNDKFIVSGSNLYANDEKINVEELTKTYCMECGEIALASYRELHYLGFLREELKECNMCREELNPDHPDFKLVISFRYENQEVDKIDEEYSIKMCRSCLLKFTEQQDRLLE